MHQPLIHLGETTALELFLDALPPRRGQQPQQRPGKAIGLVIETGQEIGADAASRRAGRHAIHVSLFGRVTDDGALIAHERTPVGASITAR